MYLVAIAWMYVVLMMAVAEALSPQGSVLGAVITFVFYGLLPLSVVLYIFGTPMRRRARLAAEAAELQAAAAAAEAAEAAASPTPQPVALAASPTPQAVALAASPAPQAVALAASPTPPGGHGHPPGDAVTAERKEV